MLFEKYKLDWETPEDLAFYTLRNRDFAKKLKEQEVTEIRRNMLLIQGWLKDFDASEQKVNDLIYLLQKSSYPSRSVGIS